MSFKAMEPLAATFLTFVLNRLMSEQLFLRRRITSSACDVDVAS